MAPRFARSQRDQMQDMLRSTSLAVKEIADAVTCSTRTVRTARNNHQTFGSVSAPMNARGRRSNVPTHVLTSLLEYLLTKPDLYLDEMADFIWDQYELDVSVDSVRRSLKACNWSKKKNRRMARERDPELRDACLFELSEYKSSTKEYLESVRIISSDAKHFHLQATIGHTCYDPMSGKPADVGHFGNAIQAASSQGHMDIVQLLLEKGSDVNAQGGHYGNAIQVASLGGHIKAVQLLLNKSADFNAQGGNYGTGLQAASYTGHAEIV